MSSNRLTEHQARVLAIVESGSAAGVAFDSVVREEQAEGRFRTDVMRTLWSLEGRGLIKVSVEITEKIGQYGPYLDRVLVATTEEGPRK